MRNIKQLIAEYDALVAENKIVESAELYAAEIKEIWDTGKSINGELDPALAITNSYAVGFMVASGLYKKEG